MSKTLTFAASAGFLPHYRQLLRTGPLLPRTPLSVCPFRPPPTATYSPAPRTPPYPRFAPPTAAVPGPKPSYTVSRRFPLASGALSPPPAPPGARGRPDRPDGDGGRRRDGPLLVAWRGYNDALARTPLRAKAATACVLNVIADLLAQVITGREGQGLDFRRLLRFALFGGVLAGPAGHYWFGALDAAVRAVGMRGAVMKMTADQLLFSPLLLAGFFGVMALMEGKGQVVARQEVEGKLPGTLLTSWKIWPIINLVNFGLIPAPMRVLFVNGLSVFWISFLSVLNGPSAEVEAAVAAS